MELNQVTFGSLFAGIGGLDLGLERAGMICKWQVEIDDYATRVLERHWPGVRRWRDIWEFIADAEKQPQREQTNKADAKPDGWKAREESCNRMSVDLICGGFPCQPVSLAGRRAGMADERWLWTAFAECIRILRPRWVLAENVPGLLSANGGRAMGTVLGDLAQLGYDAEWQVLPAAAFGLPHLRKRVFIVANREGYGRNEGGAESTWQQGRFDVAECGPTSADADEPGPQERRCQPGDYGTKRTTTERADWRTIKPTIRRGDDGVRNRVDRLRCLGNAVVPQVAEWIGKRIVDACQIG